MYHIIQSVKVNRTLKMAAENPAEPVSKEMEFMNAKSFLLTRSNKTGGNL